ncbi:MAG: bifunctional DNA-formamidopyrimidine glycosylase/DNA-(apurinic or apyrimidinic site) lyase [Candidatus Acidiferrum sp.]
MPELPEVEAVARTLRPLVEHRRIQCVHVFHAIATKPQSPSNLARTAQNQKILAVRRKGKYLWLELANAIITLHFKLDGQLLWFSGAEELIELANQQGSSVHVDVAFELDRGVLGFADRRHLGRVHFYKSVDACAALDRLGVDAISKEFTARRFGELASNSRRPLKEFLLDQSRVAGIGNIYSCEALWQARLDPRRRANSLKAADTGRLYKAIVSVLARALECCLHPEPDFRDPKWWFQGLEKILRAYDREGKPCHRCGKPIRRIAQGGRSTYFCSHCQK